MADRCELFHRKLHQGGYDLFGGQATCEPQELAAEFRHGLVQLRTLAVKLGEEVVNVADHASCGTLIQGNLVQNSSDCVG